MPLYEFRCKKCGARTELFLKRIPDALEAPACPDGGDEPGHDMGRVMSAFQRHLTETDKVAEAEAKWGKLVDDAMGPEPDVASYARRYEQLAKDLPSRDDL